MKNKFWCGNGSKLFHTFCGVDTFFVGNTFFGGDTFFRGVTFFGAYKFFGGDTFLGGDTFFGGGAFFWRSQILRGRHFFVGDKSKLTKMQNSK